MQLFPVTVPLKSVALNVLGKLFKTAHGYNVWGSSAIGTLRWPLCTEIPTLLLGHLENLCVRVWFGLIINFAVDMILRNSFFTIRFKWEISSTDRKVVPCHSHSVAIQSATHNNQHTRISTSHVPAPLGKSSSDEVANTHSICLAWQTLLKPHSQHRELVTTTAFGTNTVETRIFIETLQKTPAAQGVIKILLLKPFHIFVVNVSAKAMHLPKYIVVGYANGPFISVMTVSSTLLNHSPKVTPSV